jgi:hypothetical protein
MTDRDELVEQVADAAVISRGQARAAIRATLKGVLPEINVIADNPPSAEPLGHRGDWTAGWQDGGMEISAMIGERIKDFET